MLLRPPPAVLLRLTADTLGLRFNSTNNASLRAHRSALFSAEKRRQLEALPRLEKLTAAVLPFEGRERMLGEEEAQVTEIVLNKGISTPHDAARRELTI